MQAASEPEVVQPDPPPSSESELRSAGAPFDDKDADIIIQSSDNVHFRVHKLLLAKLFYGFEDMLGASTVGTGDVQASLDGLPVVPLSEPAKVLSPLLHMLYPVPCPDLSDDWPTLLTLCMSMDKYVAKFYPSAVIQALTKVASTENGPGPETIYVLACRHSSLRGLALSMARLTLRTPSRLDRVPATLLVGLSATQFHALFDYQNRCLRAAQDAMDAKDIVKWLPVPELPGNSTCGTNGCSCLYVDDLDGYAWEIEDVLGPAEDDVLYRKYPCQGRLIQWLKAFLDTAHAALRTNISGSAVSDTERVVAALTEMSKCEACRKSEAPKLVRFVEKLAMHVDQAIDVVPFQGL
ncbi:unnamed protein product [Peniophora sp. CBMAI 1063]|nr:unnamed protein product [Peniophora sp. CBMAI 1063]